jgi:hypothetical protein
VALALALLCASRGAGCLVCVGLYILYGIYHVHGTWHLQPQTCTPQEEAGLSRSRLSHGPPTCDSLWAASCQWRWCGGGWWWLRAQRAQGPRPKREREQEQEPRAAGAPPNRELGTRHSQIPNNNKQVRDENQEKRPLVLMPCLWNKRLYKR